MDKIDRERKKFLKKEQKLLQKRGKKEQLLQHKKELQKMRKEKKEQNRGRNQEKIMSRYCSVFEGKGDDYSRLQLILLVLRRRYISLALMTGLVFICTCIFFYQTTIGHVSGVMMLNYEESAKRLAPNNTRFNINDFASREVMDLAIEKAGLQNLITAEELSDCVGVYETANKKPIGPESYYIPTSFMITYDHPKAIREIDANNMFKVICNSYLEFFHTHYTVNASVLKGDYSNLDSFEYKELGDHFDLRIQEMISYLAMRESEGGKFKSQETGETFSSLRKLAENLRDYGLKDYKAYIWENGVMANRSLYRNTLIYSNDMNQREKKEMYNEYTIRRDTINYYNSMMATSILIPTRYKGRFYMGRTQTGVDQLASEADYYLDAAHTLELSIIKGNDRLEKSKNPNSKEQVDKATNMIKAIQTELERIEKLAVTTDQEYTNEKSKNYITFRKEQPSIFQRIDMAKAMMISLLFFLLALFAYYKECSMAVKGGGQK